MCVRAFKRLDGGHGMSHTVLYGTRTCVQSIENRKEDSR